MFERRRDSEDVVGSFNQCDGRLVRIGMVVLILSIRITIFRFLLLALVFE